MFSGLVMAVAALQPANAASAKDGGACPARSVGKSTVVKVGGVETTLKCTKVGKKYVWKSVKVASTPPSTGTTPAPATEPTAAPAPKPAADCSAVLALGGAWMPDPLDAMRSTVYANAASTLALEARIKFGGGDWTSSPMLSDGAAPYASFMNLTGTSEVMAEIGCTANGATVWKTIGGATDATIGTLTGSLVWARRTCIVTDDPQHPCSDDYAIMEVLQPHRHASVAALAVAENKTYIPYTTGKVPSITSGGGAIRVLSDVVLNVPVRDSDLRLDESGRYLLWRDQIPSRDPYRTNLRGAAYVATGPIHVYDLKAGTMITIALPKDLPDPDPDVSVAFQRMPLGKAPLIEVYGNQRSYTYDVNGAPVDAQSITWRVARVPFPGENTGYWVSSDYGSLVVMLTSGIDSTAVAVSDAEGIRKYSVPGLFTYRSILGERFLLMVPIDASGQWLQLAMRDYILDTRTGKVVWTTARFTSEKYLYLWLEALAS